MKILFSTVLGLLVAGSALAGDLSWSGAYRAEGVFIRNLALDNGMNQEDSYLTHHLILSPKIIPLDGVVIKARFDIFNNGLSNNQIGQVMGNYTGNTTSGTGQGSPSASMTKTQQDETIRVTEMYMNWVNEFGALVVGRVPFHFGLGMVFNDGSGPFDHFLSTKDIVAYRISLGNLTITPGYGKVRESTLTNEDDINDYLITVDYNNPESDLSMGFLFDNRVAPLDGSSPTSGNDIPTSAFGTGAAIYDGFSAYNMNFYVKKKAENYHVGVELGFLNGYSGVKVPNSSGGLDRVELSGFGAIADAGIKSGDWSFDLKTGLASGDDADSSRFEGFFFSPNYHVAMLMFNYPLGRYDIFRTTLAGTRAAAAATSTAGLAGLDTEIVSNTVFVSPTVTYSAGERYDLFTTITYAMLSKPAFASSAGNMSSALGFETDIGFVYKPHERFTWLNEVGLLFPGAAWNGVSGTGYKNDFSYGLTTKVAISF